MVSNSHPTWPTVRNSVNDSRRAHIYFVSKQSCFNQYQVDPKCKLCSAAPETRYHLSLNVQCMKIKAIYADIGWPTIQHHA